MPTLARDALRRARQCPACFKNAQPETVFGSPETLIERGVGEAASLTAEYAAELARVAGGKDDAKAIGAALRGARGRFPKKAFAKAVEDELLIGQMLGALDADWEAEENRQIAPVGFAATDPRFVRRPYAEAIKAFLRKKVVTKEVFDSMSETSKARAFTVAGLAEEAMIDTVRSELANAVERGSDLKDFRRFAEERLVSAGWTPENPSHVETIFRTNVMGAYSAGRYRQMTDPVVAALRPYVRVSTPNDGPPRQRPNHQKAHGLVFRVSDPVLRSAWTPWDYNCRCRFTSLSQRQFVALGVSVSDGSELTALKLPAPGFGGGPGLDDMLGPEPKPPPPPEKPTPKPRAPEKPRRPPPVAPTTPAPRLPKAGPKQPFVDIADLEPEAEAGPIAALRGVASAEVLVPKSYEKTVADALKDAGIDRYRNVQPVAFRLLDDAAWVRSHPDGARADGGYFYNTKTLEPISVDVRPRPKEALRLGQAKDDFLMNWNDTAKTPERQLALGAVHEWGHHLHIQGGPEFDRIVSAAYAEAVPRPPKPGFPVFSTQGSPTLYGVTNRKEFWSESFAAYNDDPKWLAKNKPVAFRMVRDALKLLR